MAEPRRPPPPKSYVPLDLTTGPPKLPPRPQVGDAGPPPNYTPPPPPMSDEEEEEERAAVTRRDTTPPKPRPHPPVPYQSRPQPHVPSLKQSPPSPSDGLHPAPSRPARPPTAHTPSPDSVLSNSSPSPQPRVRPRAATLANPKPPSRSRTDKGGRPETTVVSARSMGQRAIPQPMGPLPVVPSHPPTVVTSPTSPSPSSPIPLRKPPSRPPPSKKAPPTTTSQEIGPGVAEKVESTDPVAPPRKQKTLQKSLTLPPSSPDGSLALKPRTEKDIPHKTAPPKPTPYRATRPAPPKASRPREKVGNGPAEEKGAPRGQGSPVEADDGGIRIISARRPKQSPSQPRAKEDNVAEVGIDMDTEVVAQPLANERTTTETNETTERPQARKRTKAETTETTMVVDKMLPPQAKERTAQAKPTPQQSPPPKPRRSVSKETVSSDDPPQPRPRAASASQPQFHKPKPPPFSPPSPAEHKRESPVIKPSAGTSPSPPTARKRPPPPSRPPFRQSTSVEDEAAVKLEPSPKAKRRSQLVTSAELEKRPPPARPPFRQSTSVEDEAKTAVKLEPSPKAKRRSQLVTSAELEKRPPPARPPFRQSTVEDEAKTAVKLEPSPKAKRRSQLVTSAELESHREHGVPSKPRKPATPVPSARKTSEPANEEKLSLPRHKVEEPKPNTELVASQRRLTKPGVPGKPPPPRQAQSRAAKEVVGVKLSPVAKKRATASEDQGAQERRDDDETTQQVSKGQSKRRPPMVLRPALDQEQTDEPKPAKSKNSSPRPARPPARPSAQPSSKRRVRTDESTAAEVTEEPQKAKVPAKPRQPPAQRTPQLAVEQTEEPQKAKVLAKPRQPPDKRTQLATDDPQQTSTTEISGEETAETPVEVQPTQTPETNIGPQDVEKSTSTSTTQPAENVELAEHAELDPKEAASESQHDEDEGKEVECAVEAKAETDTETITETTTVGEETEQKSTGVDLPRGAAADATVVQLETHPKRARVMSTPPGRPGRPGKPPAPSTKPPGQNKPAQPPARPAHAPSRPAHGPSRPTQPRTPSRTPTAAQHDPNVPPALPPRPTPGHLLYKYVCTEPHGIAVTSHEPTDPTELPYEADDVIELVERIDNHWFFARNADLEMCEGMIPARDLRIVKRLPGESTVSGFEEGPCAVAMHTFTGQTMDELSFKEGDLIMLKTRVGAEWLRGRLVRGQEGIFPCSFVEIVEDLPADAVEELPAPTLSQSTVEIHGPHCVVLYNFAAASADELSLSAGDTVELLERVGSDWLKGRLRGQEGIFPSQFVDVKEDLPADDGFSKALFNFEGQEGELTFKAGAMVRVVSRVNEEWVEGEIEGKRGLFPVSFVDHIPQDLPQRPVSTEPTQPTKLTGKCEALFEFTGENEGELSFKTGDIIVTSEWVNEEWMNGTLGDREGLFPVAFVKILEELPKPASSADTPKVAGLSHVTKIDNSLLPRAKALRDFTATDSSHLSFKAGDVLNLLERIGSDWYSGENTRTGGFGDFPANAVTVIEPLP